MLPATVALSPESVTVLMFASGFLEHKRNWLDLIEDPMDEITDADWDKIEKLTANTYEEIMNPLIGLIFPVITANLPSNALACDGSSYLRVDYPALYAALDPAFIVDADIFTVPDLRGLTVIGASPAFPVGSAGGAEEVMLTEAQMPTHTHEPVPHQHTLGAGITILAIAPGEAPVQTPNIPFTDLTGFASAEVLPSGGSEAHTNMQPYISLRYAVVAR
jgi:microcystin-dependent protein